MKIITDDFGKIKLGDHELPGIYESMRITGSIKIDKVDIPGSSAGGKQPLGYNEPEIVLSLKLTTDNETDCYEKTKTLTNIFQNTDENAKPYIYTIINKHTEAWNISEVIFDYLKTFDTNKDNTIMAELHFQEYKPIIVEKESRAQLDNSNQPESSGFVETDQDINNDSNLPDSPAMDDDEP
ncbi:MAG: hypothetical protein PWR10_1534 [Halanaerobiales bacterium]|nr:hypothetical protein [Halanaerobiales bacterium]